MNSPARSPQVSTLGYCTNIHPGITVEEICENLQTVSAEVAQRRQGKARKLPVGLWIPSTAAVQLRRHGMQPLIDAIAKHNLLPYTINGFPYDNFHQERVKHEVYQPTWWQDDRMTYTRDLAKILGELLPEHVTTGTISTLPLGWPKQIDHDEDPVDGKPVWRDVNEEELHHVGTNFRRLAEDMRMLEDRTGKRIVIAIEPEPGCLLERSEQVVKWFDKQLPDPTHRRYIGVCHDVCHAAVMMEDQRDVLTAYADAGIVLGKVQVSSAIVADWKDILATDREAALDQLRRLAEDRYLHQTGRVKADGSFALAEDLPELIKQLPADDQKWIIHFHVPIFLERFGHLETTHNQVKTTVDAIKELTERENSKKTKALEFIGHWEVETYAWSVFPDSLRQGDLAIGDELTRQQAMARDIAHELDWFESCLRSV
jgi:sugar phosphate isomerase/epimerase